MIGRQKNGRQVTYNTPSTLRGSRESLEEQMVFFFRNGESRGETETSPVVLHRSQCPLSITNQQI